MNRLMTFSLIFFSFGLAYIASAKKIDTSELNAFIEVTMSASNIPGLAIIVFEKDGIVYERSFGIANPQNTPVTLDTPFQLGSVSKSFAALVMVQLAAEGEIDLDKPVVDYLPNFRTTGTKDWKDITLRHILSHRSGFATLDGNRIQEGNYRGADALDIIVSDLAKAKLKSTPGQTFEYSNANYMIAAAIVEKVTGQSYEAVMNTSVFDPLNMTNSYVQMPTRDSVTEAIGFRQWFGHSRAHPNIAGRAYVAAGGVTASARDLAIYVKAIADKDPRILTPEFADELITRQGDAPYIQNHWGYELGWMINEIEDKTVVYHSGLNGGFAAQAAFFPEDGRGALVLTNQSGTLQADVPGAVVRKALGMPTGPTHPSKGQHFLIWGMLSTVVILLFSFVASTVRFTTYVKRKEHVSPFRRVLPALGLFALAYVLAFAAPQMNGITLGGIKVFYPDLWLCLILSALIAGIWGITRLVYPRSRG